MKQILYTLTISYLLSSCATIITRKNHLITINTNAEHAKTEILNNTYPLPATIKVKRSKSDLPIKLIVDTAVYDYTLKSSVNPAFLFGNIFWVQVSPAAYLIDFTNQKRFYYGRSVFLDTADSVRIIRPPVSKLFHDYLSKTYPTNSAELYLHLSLPYVNSFNLKPKNEGTKINTGFWGFSLGLDYYYANDRFLNLSFSGVSDFFMPVLAPVSRGGEFESMSSGYISFSNNHRINRFTVGYGLSFAHNTWNFMYHKEFNAPPPAREPVKKSHNALGLVFPAYFQSGRRFHLGVVYRPTFFLPALRDKFKYEHLVSVDLGLKIRVRKQPTGKVKS